MKKVKFLGYGLIIFLGLQSTTVSAQDSTEIKTLSPVTVTASTKKIPDRIWKSFSTYFNEAENPRWFSANKNYLVKFMIYDEENRALFTKRGRMIYHISYGYENNMPDDIYKLVRTSYFEYDITRVVRVSQEDRLVWVVNLENPDSIILVRVEDGELQEVQRLKKSPGSDLE